MVKSARKLIGATNPLEAEPGTIRGDLAVQTGRNVIHGSDSPENGERETGTCPFHRRGDGIAKCMQSALSSSWQHTHKDSDSPRNGQRETGACPVRMRAVKL